MKIIKNICLFIIQVIEYIEYRKLGLDENDHTKKIIQSLDINKQVMSDSGWVDATQIHKTQPYRIYDLTLENGYTLSCADKHILFDEKLQEVFVCDMKVNDNVMTRIGASKVTKIKKSRFKVSMFDMSIDSENHRYFTSGILSHNTISASIDIVYYSIFNNDKNIMIVANKRATTNEIIEKIKGIYYELPFFLKVGVTNWNQNSVTFKDTNCKIRSVQANPEAGIGFAIDYLYVDEMAYIQENIAQHFYKSIIPTVVSINNSRIVFTSTPSGYNLFWSILSKAELPKGDKDKNRFHAKRVYWYEVNGRFVTYLRINDNLIEKHKMTPLLIYNHIKNLGFQEEILDVNGFIECAGIKMIKNGETDSYEIHIPNTEDYIPKNVIVNKESPNPLSDYFRKESVNNLEGKYIRILDVCEISSWKEDAIKDIGSLESFNQEYDLQPLSGASMLFSSEVMLKIKNQIIDFKYIEIEKLKQTLFNEYEDLTWIYDTPDLFDISRVKDYFMTMSIDIGEGLGGDYSVINFFRVLPKDISEMPYNIKSLYDCFKLEQVGMYHSNITSVQELAELSYVMFFEIFDPEKILVVLEANNWGNEFTKTMREIYNGRNEYSSHIFARYKHRLDAKRADIGIKLRSQKEKLVKDYQKRIKQEDIRIHSYAALVEMTSFIKKETQAGNFKYEADSGSKDDIVMSLVEIATVFENIKFHNLVEELFEQLPIATQKHINFLIDESPMLEATDYSIITNININKRQ